MDDHLTGWPALIADAAARHGVFHLRRCTDYGLSRLTVRNRATREGWVRPFPSVVCLPGSADTWWRTASAALESVGADGALALWSAAHAQSMVGRPPTGIQVARSNGKHRSRQPELDVHVYRTLTDGGVGIVNGLRCTTPHRTVRDLSHVADVAGLRAVMIDGVQARVLDLSLVTAEVEGMWAGPARRRLEQAVKDLARVNTESPFAYEVLEAVRAMGLEIEGEFPWRCPDGRVIHHDGAFPASWVSLECDGRGKYAEGGSFAADRKRWTQTSEHWRTVWIDWKRWHTDRQGVLRDILRALAAADPSAKPAQRASCRCRRCRP